MYVETFDIWLTREELAAVRYCLLQEVLRRDTRAQDAADMRQLSDELVRRAQSGLAYRPEHDKMAV